MSSAATNLNGNGIQRVPTLDDLARYPDRAQSLPDRTLAALASRALLVLAVLNEARTAAAEAATFKAPEIDEYTLTPDQAAVLIHKPRRWIIDNRHRLSWVSKVSGKTFLCSESGIRKWLATRRA
jgi:hypothetical protein